MPVNDPLGDLLTRVRNAQRVGHKTVKAPKSKLKTAVLDVLLREGYIRAHHTDDQDVTVELKYADGQPAIQTVTRVSKPGRRVYTAIKVLPKVSNGLGISILSTPQGVMSDNEARAANVGGEVLCTVF